MFLLYLILTNPLFFGTFKRAFQTTTTNNREAGMPDNHRPFKKKRLSPAERRDELVAQGVITEQESMLLARVDLEASGLATENPFGFMSIPLGLAKNFVVNGRRIEHGIPMATEEISVVAAASKAAKLALPEGFKVKAPRHAVARGHVFYAFENLTAAQLAYQSVTRWLPEMVAGLRHEDPLVKHGGGLLEVSPSYTHPVDEERVLLTLKISINPAEAMGANAVTRVGERLAAMIKASCEIDATGTICTNHASGWEVEASASWHKDAIGENRLRKMLDWQTLARIDLDRAVTHNKGIMNGTVAVALATGQDTRSIEACVHATNAYSRYTPLTSFEFDPTSDVLRGKLKIMLPVATKGGRTGHPQAEINRKIMGATSARELACIMAAVGLAQNFAALHCLSGEGIPASHATLAKARQEG
jgi:hydroxymethylglutaryl-CoA reductase